MSKALEILAVSFNETKKLLGNSDVVVSEPYGYTARALVDLPHQPHLLGSFVQVLLVNADGIDPEPSRFTLEDEGTKGVRKINCDG